MSIVLGEITERQKLIIAKGLLDYQFIMDNWKTNSQDFMTVYYEFYLKARWAVMSKDENRCPYFEKLQRTNKNENLIDIVVYLKENTAQKDYELSLCSKLLHTVNPNSPIYDSKVKKYLSKEESVELWWHKTSDMFGKGAPRKTTELEKIRHDWACLCVWYESFLESKVGQEWIAWFDNNFPSYRDISNVKKIDFIIFATN